MILPGEFAPAHRHSSHALRVIIESEGSFSVVNGEKTPMETGDVVLTPGWCWHAHGHEGDKPAYWFDGLDVPLTQLLEPMFYEEHPQRREKIERALRAPHIGSRARRLLASLIGLKLTPRDFTARGSISPHPRCRQCA
jgi:gentisate 1,2-dioxygenase